MASHRMISKKQADDTNVLLHDDLEQEECIKLLRKRSLFDVDFDELPDSAGRYTCPNGNCIFSNYVFGFESRTDRNKHTVKCPFGDGNVPLYVPSDGQMPSAKLINELIDAFPGNPNLKILFQCLFLKSPESVIPAFSSLKTAPTASSQIDVTETQNVVSRKLTSDPMKNCTLVGTGQFLENMAVSFYEELGKLMFERCSFGSGGGGGGGGDGGKGGEFSGNYVIENERIDRVDYNGIVMKCEEKVDEEVDDSQLVFMEEEAFGQVGFQVGVIDEFLNEKSYLLDDDICLE